MSTIPDTEKHHRRSIRLKDYDYSQFGAYFVTICMKEMKCILGKIQNGKMRLSRIGRIIHQYWEEIPNHFDSSCPIIKKGLINQTPTSKTIRWQWTA